MIEEKIPETGHFLESFYFMNSKLSNLNRITDSFPQTLQNRITKMKIEPSSTLTSLAILKVNIDQGKDYLDYLKPFILDILAAENLEIIKTQTIHDSILTKFGLNIPEQSIQILLKRIARKYSLKKEEGVYRITGSLPSSNMDVNRNKAARHIQAIISGLINFSKSTVSPIDSDKRAEKALLLFLSEFNIPCLKAYLRGTAIPDIDKSHKGDIVLVSKYIIELQNKNPERFESFMILMQGHMFANALTCPDLSRIPETYKGVTFYFDTPLLLQLLGLDIKHKEDAVKNLIKLLHSLRGVVAVFSHSRDELKGVIEAAAEYLEHPKGQGSIIREARHSGRTKSDLLLMAQKINDSLSEFQIKIKQTPQYEHEFQIDETLFDHVLEDEISYHKQRAKEHDINSVRSIYVLRKGIAPDTVERARAVLVSSNLAFARAAYKYGERHDELRHVSSVITSFSLANMAWLKAPMGAVDLPRKEILAFSYAALCPDHKILNKYLKEIERLEKKDKITAQDHQLLRSKSADDELMRLTLGDEAALNEETVTETLRRITSEIKKEESDKLEKEKKAHEKTQKLFNEERQKNQSMIKKLYWDYDKKAKHWSWILTVLFILFQAVLIFLSLWLSPSLFITVILTILFLILDIFELKSLVIQRKIKKYLLKKYVRDSLFNLTPHPAKEARDVRKV